MGGERVLIVEDNPENMALIAEVLTSLEYEVLEATNGADGIRVALQEQPDLILMDLSLPRVDGWTVARHIKSDPILGGIPIIALTAHALVGDRERALEAGCDDYLAKPVNLRELAHKLRQHIR